MSINITKGNTHRIRIALTRYGEPMAVSLSSNVVVSVVKELMNSVVILERTLSATEEGVIEAAVPAVLKAGNYSLVVTGHLEGEGDWRMSAAAGIVITTDTQEGGESLTMYSDSFDVTASVTVMQGISGSEEELRERIAGIIEEEYNASEQIRVQNETERQSNEGQRQESEAQRTETFNSDHQRAERDHSRAESDHDRAETDHNRADSDHNTSTEKSAYAQQQGDYAKQQGDYAKDEIDGAKGGYDSLDDRFDHVDQIAMYWHQTATPSSSEELVQEYDRVLRQAYQCITDLLTAKSETQAATSSANAAATATLEAIRKCIAATSQSETATQNAVNAANAATIAAGNAENMASEAQLAAQNAGNAATRAEENAHDAQVMAAYAKQQGDYAKAKADEVQEARGEYTSLSARLEAMQALLDRACYFHTNE